MTIRFDMEMEDLLAFQRNFYGSNKHLRKQGMTLRSVFFLGGAIFFWPAIKIISAGYPAWHIAPLTLILCGLLWCTLAFLSPKWLIDFNVRNARRQYLKPESESSFGATEMEFGEDGFTVDRKGIRGRMSWASVLKIAETKDYFFLYVTDVAANTIPKRKLTEQEVGKLNEMFNKHVK